jgi:hypothetical protein
VSAFINVDKPDRHSTKIKQNKSGLRRGANFKQARGDITEAQRLEIFDKVRLAQLADFKPLLYVIPYSLVSSLLVAVPVKHRANTMADEFIIQRLSRTSFDIIDP